MGLIITTAIIHSLFVLDVRTLEAVEGGPVSFEVTLKYVGRKPINVVYLLNKAVDFEILPSATWPVLSRDDFQLNMGMGTSRSGIKSMPPGETTPHRFDVHNLFVGDIPAGPATFQFRAKMWVRFGDSKDALTRVSIKKDLTVSIDRFTPLVAVGFARRFNESLAHMPESSQYDRGQYLINLANLIFRTRHPEFASIALKMMKLDLPQFARWRLREYMSSLPQCLPLLHDFDVKDLLAGARNSDPYLCFSDWQLAECTDMDKFLGWVGYLALEFLGRPRFDATGRGIALTTFGGRGNVTLRWLLPRLPAEYLDRLKRADNFWLRALVYCTFTDRLGREWNEWFLADLRNEVRKVPDATLKKWLSELDADDFRTRDTASRQFQAHISRCRSFLKDAAAGKLTPEARHRVDLLLKIPVADTPYPDRFAVAFGTMITGDRSPAMRRVLNILSEGSPDTLIVREMKAVRAR